MKKIFKLFPAFIVVSILAGCPDKLTTLYRTIESVSVLLFSFDENGIFPHTESYNINELGIGIFADSLYDTYELAAGFSPVNSAYAMEPRVQTIYTNAIDSIHVFTLCDFDQEHPAGSSVNDILLVLDGIGGTQKLTVNELSGEAHYFKLSTVPQNDSLQFEISGRIRDVGNFRLKTDLAIIK